MGLRDWSSKEGELEELKVVQGHGSGEVEEGELKGSIIARGPTL